ncbi:MAG: M16 family metallopeptidase [Caulobacter sp.]
MPQLNRFARPALIAVTVAALAACAQVKALLPGKDRPVAEAPRASEAAPARAAAPSPRALARGQWPQATTDVAPDPAVRFGTLPNGMRYAIMRNATPPGQASIRLHFRVGSLWEADDQQGLAHFLEHMAFNGSKAIPEGEMVKILERHGLAFGADTNASTSFDETIYKLDLPKTDDETVDVSLKMMRETAGELLIESGAVDRERGIVLSEERSRDSPGYRLYQARLEFLMKGQRPPQRYPIGKVEVLQNAPRDRIVAFYDAYYRPERATLVIVGDFDVDAMEGKVKSVFGDWKPRAPDGVDPDLGKVAKRGTEARVFVDPGVPTAIQITWIAPPVLERDSTAKRKADLIRQLGFSVLNRRFSAMARGSEPPFISAGAMTGNQFDAARFTSIAVVTRPGEWQSGMAAAEREQRRFVRYGVLQEELDREIAEYRTFFQTRAAGAATRRTPSLAGEILGTFAESEVVTNPAQDLALFEETVKDLKADTVSKAAAAAFSGEGPLIFVASPTALSGGEGAVLAAYESSRKVEVTPPTNVAQVEWPYASFGTPGKVAEQREVLDLDTTFIRFENGVRLTVKPTRFRDDQVLVRVRVGGGFLDLSPDRQSMGWAASALAEGGLGKIAVDDMERVLAPYTVGASFGFDDEAFIFSGGTRPEDLPIQMQLMAAYVSDPGWRPEAFQRIRTYAQTLDEQYDATTGGVLSRSLPGLMHNGDRRWTWPGREEIAGAKLEDLKTQVGAALATGPIEIIIVGDVTVEKATQAVAETFGALPRRAEPVARSTDSRTVGFPAGGGEPVVLTHKGRPDQAVAMVVWRTDDFWTDVQRARNTSVLSAILDLRLTDELREKQGVTYSPSVGNSMSQTWTDWGYLSASIEAPPATSDGFFRDVFAIVADLRDKPPTEDELLRAKRPMIERLTKSQVTNEYWLSVLAGAQTDPRRLDSVRSVIAGIERVTPQDVQAAARMFLTDDRAWRVIVRPAAPR